MTAGFKRGSDAAAGAVALMTLRAMEAAGVTTHAEAMAVVDDVLEMAREWRAGRLPLPEIRRLTTPETRFLAARYVRPQPPELKGLLDALIDDDATSPEGFTYRTKHGMFTGHDLDAARTRMDQTPDGLRLRFPQRQPWLVLPDDKKGEPGIRADPVYAADQEERIRIANDAVTTAFVRKQDQRNRSRWKDMPTGDDDR